MRATPPCSRRRPARSSSARERAAGCGRLYDILLTAPVRSRAAPRAHQTGLHIHTSKYVGRLPSPATCHPRLQKMRCNGSKLAPARRTSFDPGFEGSGRWRPCVTQRARGFEGSAAPRRRPWDADGAFFCSLAATMSAMLRAGAARRGGAPGAARGQWRAGIAVKGTWGPSPSPRGGRGGGAHPPGAPRRGARGCLTDCARRSPLAARPPASRTHAPAPLLRSGTATREAGAPPDRRAACARAAPRASVGTRRRWGRPQPRGRTRLRPRREARAPRRSCAAASAAAC